MSEALFVMATIDAVGRPPRGTRATTLSSNAPTRADPGLGRLRFPRYSAPLTPRCCTREPPPRQAPRRSDPSLTTIESAWYRSVGGAGSSGGGGAMAVVRAPPLAGLLNSTSARSSIHAQSRRSTRAVSRCVRRRRRKRTTSARGGRLSSSTGSTRGLSLAPTRAGAGAHGRRFPLWLGLLALCATLAAGRRRAQPLRDRATLRGRQ
jgi:hypothetical protein